jgi:hypothetical protein
MQTLLEIIETAKNGEMPSHEECFWAMLALDALHSFDHRSLRNLATKHISTPQLEWEASFWRIKRALEKDPETWVGPNNDPSNPDYQKMRAVSVLFKILLKSIII